MTELTSGKDFGPSHEILPYLIYRRRGDELECAVWQVQQGQQALALFLSAASAEAYIQAADLDSQWKVFCPGRSDLLEILQQSVSGGIWLAALDPDQQGAKRLFDLRRVVENGGLWGDRLR